MSLVQEILRITARYHPAGYKQLYEHLYNETPYGKKLNKNSLSATLSRMSKQGLLKRENGKLKATLAGKEKLDYPIETGIRKFANPIRKQVKPGERKLIVIFDIPENMKLYREWLRSELVGFGFTMIQKSVWLGPSVPKEFVKYLSECGILKHVRFFRVKESDLI